MIISHSKQFIFIKTRKTAGSSLQQALAMACSPGDILVSSPDLLPPWRKRPDKIAGVNGHTGKNWIRENYPDEWRRYTKISCERHPLDKTVSLYYWQTREDASPNASQASPLHDEPSRPSFRDWWPTQSRLSDFTLYGNRTGEVLVDNVILYEDLQSGYERLCEALGLDIHPLGLEKSGVRPRSEFVAGDYYDQEMLRQMREIFQWEIKAFGYRI